LLSLTFVQDPLKVSN